MLKIKFVFIYAILFLFTQISSVNGDENEINIFEKLHGSEFINHVRENQERYDRNYDVLSKKIKLINKYIDERRFTESDQMKLIGYFDRSIDNILKSKILLNNRLNEMKSMSDKKFIIERVKKLESVKEMLEMCYSRLVSYSPRNRKKRMEDRENMHDIMSIVNFGRFPR